MFQLWKILAFSFFALTATLPSQIHASPDIINDDVFSPLYQPSSPSPSPYVPDEESQNPNYVRNPSLPPNSPAPSAEADDDHNAFHYSPSKAPSPSPSPTEFYSGLSDEEPADMAPQVADTPPPVLPFNYSAEDDSGEFSTESDDDEVYPEEQRKSRAVIGFVVGAVCLVGLGGLVYKNRKNKIQKRNKQTMYMQLSKKDEEA